MSRRAHFDQGYDGMDGGQHGQMERDIQMHGGGAGGVRYQQQPHYGEPVNPPAYGGMPNQYSPDNYRRAASANRDSLSGRVQQGRPAYSTAPMRNSTPSISTDLTSTAGYTLSGSHERHGQHNVPPRGLDQG